MIVLSEPIFIDQRHRIAELASRYRVPTVFSRSEGVDAGGLISYGPSLVGQFRQAVVYVDKVFRGVNLRTARALGVAIPQSVLVRTDRMIE